MRVFGFATISRRVGPVRFGVGIGTSRRLRRQARQAGAGRATPARPAPRWLPWVFAAVGLVLALVILLDAA